MAEHCLALSNAKPALVSISRACPHASSAMKVVLSITLLLLASGEVPARVPLRLCLRDLGACQRVACRRRLRRGGGSAESVQLTPAGPVHAAAAAAHLPCWLFSHLHASPTTLTPECSNARLWPTPLEWRQPGHWHERPGARRRPPPWPPPGARMSSVATLAGFAMRRFPVPVSANRCRRATALIGAAATAGSRLRCRSPPSKFLSRQRSQSQ